MHICIDGVNIRCEQRGEGDPVLLLHGWGGCVESISPLIDHVVSRGKRAISFDFPGHGESGEPSEPWSVTQYANCTEKLLEYLGINSCDVIAHSFGARVTILLAGTRVGLFNKIVLTGAAGLIPKRSLKYYYNVYKYKLGKRAAKIGFINTLFNVDSKIANAGSEEYRALSGVMKQSFVLIVNQNLFPYLKNISSPTLLIWGSEDTSTPLYMAKIMEKEIPDSGLVVFEGATHFAYLEESGRFCAIVDSFFRG